MLLLTLILVLLLVCPREGLIPLTTLISAPLHSMCLDHSPDSQFQPEYQAIVCGESPKISSSIVSDMKVIGIYHLLVVSGSHLVFLFEILLRLFAGSKLRRVIPLILLLYGLISGFQPPVVRSLLQLSMTFFSDRYHLGWSRIQLVGLSGLMCWGLHPVWIESRSFVLSWSASLGLAIGDKLITRVSHPVTRLLILHTIVFILILPALWGIGNPTPMTILTNVVLSEIVGFCLLPVSLIAFVIQPITPWTDLFWKGLGLILQTLRPYFEQAETDSARLSPLTIWLPICVTHVFEYFLLRWQFLKKWDP